MTARTVEHARGQNGAVGTYDPDPTGPLTWHRCIASGCDMRVHPWDHNTRCPKHRPPDDHRGDDARERRREVARAIVTANRERART